MEDSYLDEHFAKAKSWGAKIIIELRTEDYGGRNYSCADLEGHLWSFGSYNPWTSESKSGAINKSETEISILPEALAQEAKNSSIINQF